MTLTCVPETTDVVIDVKWYKDDVMVEGVNSTSYEIGNRKSAGGTYACAVCTGHLGPSRISVGKAVSFLCK